MVFFRIQAGDFQDAGIDGNLNKLEQVLAHGNQLEAAGERVSIDVIGDWFDTHSLNELLDQYTKMMASVVAQEHPEEAKAVIEFQEYKFNFNEKHGVEPELLLAIGKISPGEKQRYEQLKKEAEVYQEKYPVLKIDPMRAITDFYSVQEGMIQQSNIKVYGVRGNNDPLFIQDILRSVTFTDLTDMVTDGPFRIIGANNTNHAKEKAFPGEVAFKVDDHKELEKSEAYQKHNIKKTKKRANIMQLHGPPNGLEFRNGNENLCMGVAHLIREHAPDLIMCGHFDGQAKIKAFKIKGKWVTVARSSKHEFFRHKFDGYGKYTGTEIFAYN